MGSSVQQALLDRAQELEKASERLRQSAEQVRIAQILNQLENLLLTEKDLLDEYLLLRAALLVAQLDNPHFHLSSYLKKMDSIALRISENIPNSATPKEKLDIVLDQLFIEYGFRGSTLDFHHRANS